MYDNPLTFLITGIVLGFSAGISPGPLLTLVISESLSHGVKAGVKVAIAPILSDAPILFASYFFVREFSKTDLLLGIISLLGALFLFYLGYKNFRFNETDYENHYVWGSSVKKGILTNVLNPHPYIFWFSVGAPLIVSALRVNYFSGIIFLCGFYLLLVGSKIAAAVLAGKIKSFISDRSYFILLKIVGIALIVFGLILLSESFNYLIQDPAIK